MSYQALARKWRPRQFDEVLGQEHVVAALSNALNSERVHHAYLFTGTRGVGKTTLARIFARALNCEQGVSANPCGECSACVGVDQGNFIDLLEVDAASRTRVDDTRELLDNVQYAPTQGRFKIYLIDEVHMLSTHSFNALLKTLEEPPAHVKFLLATTDPQKLPATILSRCIQFNLKAMDVDQLDRQLDKILVAEGIEADQEARRILARAADGSVRDALSLLDQAVAFGNGEVRSEQVRGMLGMIDDRFVSDLLNQVLARDGAAVLSVVADMAERSANYGGALNEVLGRIHYAALHQVSPDAVTARGIDAESVAGLAEQADPELLQLLYQMALIGKRDFALAPDPRTGFEMAMLRLVAFQPASGSSDGGNRTRSTTENPAPVPPKRDASPLRADSNRNQATGLDAIRRGRDETTKRAATKPEAAPAPQPPQASARSADDTSVPAEPPIAVAESGKGQGDNQGDSQSGDQGVDLNSLGTLDGWSRFIEHSNLNGMARELVMNMSPVRVEGNCLHVTLDQNAKNLMNDARHQRLEQQIGEQVGCDFRLEFDVVEIAADQVATPSRQKQKAADDRQQAAEQVFEEDPNVQSLVDLFDAEVIPDSVRPTSPQ